MQIPDTYPAVQIDDMLSANIGKACDMQIHSVIGFDGRINVERLKRAVRLSVDAEPVLGCHLQYGWWRQHWTRCTNSALENICTVTETIQLEKDLLEFMIAPYDCYKDPALQVRLLRSDTDTICIKLSHIAVDGGGAKEYLKLLGSIYRKLSQEPDYYPAINSGGCRDFHQVTRCFSFVERVKNFRLVLRDYLTDVYPPRSWQYPMLNRSDRSRPTYVIHRLDADTIKGIKAYAKKHGYSLTDVMVAAIYRALYAQIQPAPATPLRLGTTVDLRRYLPKKKGQALCNLAAMFYLNIGNDIGEDFIETVEKVHKAMDKHKKYKIGMGDNRYIFFDSKLLPFSIAKSINLLHRVFKYKIGPKQISPLLTQGGRLDNTLRHFAECPIKDAYMTAPVAYAPVFFMGIIGFAGSFTMSAGFCESAIDRSMVEEFFTLVEENLVSVGILQPPSVAVDAAG